VLATDAQASGAKDWLAGRSDAAAPSAGGHVAAPSSPAKGARPRRLRLSTILIELGVEARPLISVAGEPNVEIVPGQSIDDAIPQNISKRRRRKLRRKLKQRVQSNMTIGEIVERTAHAGFGFLAAFLALVAIPFFGLSTPFGLAIGFVGVQMAAGLNRPWLPSKLKRHVVMMSTLEWLGHGLARWTGWLEKLVRPRFTLLAWGPFWTLVGMGIMIQGMGLALPLPIPGSNWLFIVPILFYAIGLLEDDGVLIVIGHVCSAIQVVLGIVFWQTIYDAVGATASWMGSWF